MYTDRQTVEVEFEATISFGGDDLPVWVQAQVVPAVPATWRGPGDGAEVVILWVCGESAEVPQSALSAATLYRLENMAEKRAAALV
jgi:hypothetical protein